MGRKSKLVYVGAFIPGTLKRFLIMQAKKENRSLSNHIRITLERIKDHGKENEKSSAPNSEF